jgi:hypothetical protein
MSKMRHYTFMNMPQSLFLLGGTFLLFPDMIGTDWKTEDITNSLVRLSRAVIPFLMAEASWPNYHQKVKLLDIVPLGVRFLSQTFRPQQTDSHCMVFFYFVEQSQFRNDAVSLVAVVVMLFIGIFCSSYMPLARKYECSLPIVSLCFCFFILVGLFKRKRRTGLVYSVF